MIMHLTAELARHFRDVHFGGNWTSSNLKDHLTYISWQHAATKVFGVNSIAALVFHMHYYVSAVLKVLEGEPLNASDKYSFDCPAIESQDDWEKLLADTFADAEKFAVLIEKLPEEKLWEDFSENKYGNYYRNLHGIIEHIHYHLGQIVVIRKILLQTSNTQ